METTEIKTNKPFAINARLFLQSLIRQRIKLINLNRSRINKYSALQAVDTLNRYLTSYYFTDEAMASFIVKHITTIMSIIPGENSGSHSKRMKDLLKIYNTAVQIKTRNTMKKFSYYQISNDCGEAYVKTNDSNCVIGSITHEGLAAIKQVETCYKKSNGDVAVEISKDQFITGMKKVMNVIKKDNGL